MIHTVPTPLGDDPTGITRAQETPHGGDVPKQSHDAVAVLPDCHAYLEPAPPPRRVPLIGFGLVPPKTMETIEAISPLAFVVADVALKRLLVPVFLTGDATGIDWSTPLNEIEAARASGDGTEGYVTTTLAVPDVGATRTHTRPESAVRGAPPYVTLDATRDDNGSVNTSRHLLAPATVCENVTLVDPLMNPELLESRVTAIYF